jgi:hypothetical protein
MQWVPWSTVITKDSDEVNIREVPWGTVIPKDSDEVNRREIVECDGDIN